MTTLAIHRDLTQAIALPPPRGGEVNIRLAELKDVPFIDALQRKHSRMVGWFPTKQIEANISKGKVLIAEELLPLPLGEGRGEGVHDVQVSPDMPSPLTPLPRGEGKPVGYCISSDRYLKNDACGIVYQLNVAPGKQRGLIGATLIKAVFDRAAYGCKLFCCWCAQDLQANHFWESLGFVPLAFRTGSRPRKRKDGTISKPERIHIFWQRRIREGDFETPYWFPAETSGGAVKENRLVLPIPPGTHWADAKPAVLPGMDEKLLCHSREGGNPADGDESPPARGRREKKVKAVGPPRKISRGLWFSPSPGNVQAQEAQKAATKAAKPPRKRPREKFKHDPKVVEAARELRDRYIEQINLAPGMLLPPSACGKYDVSRQLACGAASIAGELKPLPLLDAA